MVVGTILSGWSIEANFSSLGSGTGTIPVFGSMVQNGKLAASIPALVKALKSVDLPTFGKPTIPQLKPTAYSFGKIRPAAGGYLAGWGKNKRPCVYWKKILHIIANRHQMTIFMPGAVFLCSRELIRVQLLSCRWGEFCLNKQRLKSLRAERQIFQDLRYRHLLRPNRLS